MAITGWGNFRLLSALSVDGLPLRASWTNSRTGLSGLISRLRSGKNIRPRSRRIVLGNTRLETRATSQPTRNGRVVEKRILSRAGKRIGQTTDTSKPLRRRRGADHPHTIDRWDDATGENLIEQIAGVTDCQNNDMAGCSKGRRRR